MLSFSFFEINGMKLLMRGMFTNIKINKPLMFKLHHTNLTSPQSTALFYCIKQNYNVNLAFNRCMAGHSKWQNVKHIKAEKDRQKTLICNKYAFLLRLAIRESGPDPKLNSKLGNLIEQAKKNNIPSSVVENALKKDNNKKLTFGSMEILGPAGCIILLEYETDNVSTTRHEIKTLCRKFGVNILSGEGRWRAAYEQKGIIKVTSQKNAEPLDAEKALDAAIEAGAEDVKTRDDEETPYLEFLCGPDDLNLVKKEVEKIYEVEEGYVGYIPISTVKLDEETLKVFDNFLEELGSLPDVIRIYENVQ